MGHFTHNSPGFGPAALLECADSALTEFRPLQGGSRAVSSPEGLVVDPTLSSRQALVGRGSASIFYLKMGAPSLGLSLLFVSDWIYTHRFLAISAPLIKDLGSRRPHLVVPTPPSPSHVLCASRAASGTRWSRSPHRYGSLRLVFRSTTAGAEVMGGRLLGDGRR